MRAYFSILCLTLLSFSSIASSLSIRQQLCELNPFWKQNTVNIELLHQVATINSETELIQLHLGLIIEELRLKDVSHLSLDQRENRAKSLNILEAYKDHGVFPINLYHAERTPYFIDHKGTACAVGYMIIETGESAVAQRIHKENNYGKIYELIKVYPEIIEWANLNGFTVAELAWIQPWYGCTNSVCAANQVVQPTCQNSYDGCIGEPDPTGSGLTPPYMYQFYMSTDSGQTWGSTPNGTGCDLDAGYYKWVVTGSSGNTADFVTILAYTNPLDTSITLNAGTLTANAAGATYQWVDCNDFMTFIPGETNQSFTPQSSGNYALLIQEGTSCWAYSSCYQVQVSGIEEPLSDNLSYYPNPTSGLLNLKLHKAGYSIHQISITNLDGKQVYQKKNIEFTGGELQLDLNDVSPGMYFIRLETDQGATVTRVVKE